MIALLRRDLALAVRSGGGFGQALAFFLIVVVFIPFGVGSDPALLAPIAPGVLWVGALLASILSAERLLQPDFDDGSLEAMAVAGLPPSGIVAVKALGHWLTTGLPLACMAPVLGVLLQLPGQGYLAITFTLVLGTPALSLLATFGAALTLPVRRGGLLLPLLVMPFYIPTLIFGATAASRATQGLDASSATALLAGVSALAAALVPLAGGAALKVNLK